MDRPHIGKSTFWNHLCHKIFGPREGGAKVIVDAEDAALGAGKTSAAVALARHLATAFGYDLKKEDLTLSATEYIDRYREHPGRDQPSVLVLDEAVGAGAGDARRAMSNSNLDLASAWQTMRVKRVVTIATLAHWGDLDSRLQRLSDYRLNCKTQPIGRYRPYQVKVGFDDGHVRTKTLDAAIHFPDMAGDPYYEHVSERKDELLAASTWDADALVEDEEEDDEEEETVSPKEIADEILEDDLEEYISTHRGNGTKYIDKTLIKIDYDLSHRKAKEVQTLLERARETEVTAD